MFDQLYQVNIYIYIYTFGQLFILIALSMENVYNIAIT
jgi:hypothetical protein